MPFEDLTGTVVQKTCMACSREFQGNIGQCPHDGNALIAPLADQWLDKRLAGKYLISKKLGTGGMGEVYLAWHELMQTWVAIKFLKSCFIDEPTAVKRFQREAQAAKRLKHPNVISIYDLDIAPNGQPYMVMEYLLGLDEANPAISLARFLKQQSAKDGQVNIEQLVHIIEQACGALDHAHRKGVIHRDIKPANIMIVPNEQDKLFVKVVDFGVAKLLPVNDNTREEAQSLTTFGEVCGSPVYMSPEQCRGDKLSPSADIYSMGVVLYEAITGKVPFFGRNMMETMQKHLEETPKPFHDVRPDLCVPDKLEQVVMRALKKAPQLRQQSMAELAQDLRFSFPQVSDASQQTARKYTSIDRADSKSKLSLRVGLLCGGAVATVGIILLCLFWLNSNKIESLESARQLRNAQNKNARHIDSIQSGKKSCAMKAAATTDAQAESQAESQAGSPATARDALNGLNRKTPPACSQLLSARNKAHVHSQVMVTLVKQKTKKTISKNTAATAVEMTQDDLTRAVDWNDPKVKDRFNYLESLRRDD